MKQKIVCLVVFVLMFECCLTLDVRMCVNGIEIGFFLEKRLNRADAKEACKIDGYSGLVKVHNRKITKAINSVLKIDKTICFIDGRADNNRKWTWSDGDKIYLREDKGYENWFNNQPNNFKNEEECIIVGRGTKQWKDSKCIELLGYICQKDADPCITVDSSTPETHICSATGSNTPHVEWRKANVTVSTNSNQTVHQTKEEQMATLLVKNATIGDRGEYVCAAWIRNKIKFSENIIIKVNGTPLIVNIKSYPCNSSLLVSWKPNRHAIGFPHRLSAFATNGSLVFTTIVTPVDDIEKYNEIRGLQHNSEYNIRITACQQNEHCADYMTRTKATTNGAIQSVTNASLTQLSENNTCTASWDWPYNISMTEFKVTLLQIFPNGTSETEGTNQSTISTTGLNEYSFSFEPLPKHSYEVKIQTLKSVGLCRAVKAQGTCVGKVEDVPETSTLSTVSENVSGVGGSVSPQGASAGNDVATKIVLPIVGTLFLLIIVILLIVFIRKRRNKSVENNAVSLGMRSLQPSSDVNEYAAVDRERIPNQQEAQDSVYAMASEFPAASNDIPVYAAVNKTKLGKPQDSTKKQYVSGNDTYASLHFDQSNTAFTSTSCNNQQYSNIAGHPASESDTYDILNVEQTSSASQPVYAAVNKNK